MLKTNTKWLFQNLYDDPFNVVTVAIDSISARILKAQYKARIKKIHKNANADPQKALQPCFIRYFGQGLRCRVRIRV